MKKVIILSVTIVISVVYVSSIYSGHCYDQWTEYASATRCDLYGIDCEEKPYLAGPHNCCIPGTTFENCPLGNAEPNFISWFGGTCSNLPCEGISWEFCVGGAAYGQLTPAPFWAPDDKGLGVCWLPMD